MKRGEIWTVVGRGEFMSKPRPAIILQDDTFNDLLSATVCPITTRQLHDPPVRVPIEPSEINGLDAPSRIMVDRIETVRKSRLGVRVGRLSDEDQLRLNQAVIRFLALATSDDEWP